MVSADSKENLKRMAHANNCKKEAMTQAKNHYIDSAHDYFDESSMDEARHA